MIKMKKKKKKDLYKTLVGNAHARQRAIRFPKYSLKQFLDIFFKISFL